MEECEEIFYSAEFAVYQVIEDLINKGGELLYDRYVEICSRNYSVAATIAVLSSTTESFYFRRESGEPIVWEEAPEPKPSNIDTWARKAVPIKKVYAIPKIEPFQNPTLPDARSVHSHTSRRSIYGRLNKSSRNKNFKDTEAIEESITAEPIPVIPNENNDQEELLRTKKEREIKKKREENERMKKMKEEEDQKEKKIVKDTEFMKNKIFTYDCKGKILNVNHMKPESIPAGILTVRYHSQDPVIEEPKPIVKKKPTSEMQPAKRIKTTPQHEQDWVKNLTLLQPPLFDSIRLSVGVTLVDGQRTKRSTESVDFRFMTRKQYNQTFHSSMNQTVILNPPLERRSSIDSSVDSEYKNHEGKKDFLESIPDYEDFKGDNQGTKNVSISMSPIRPGHGKVVKYGTGFEASEQSGPNDKFNAEILKNKNWGLNPPMKEPKVIERLPKKSSTKEMRELYGDILKKPKDNPFITPSELWEASGGKIKKPRDRPNIERIEKKTRMPPPPYGFTMVNALPELSGLANSFNSGKADN
ncbi:hypothetical protein SteCoe_21107 [Stentor coeruleus]|uniref:Uncharacterized protein n=1 Tax=Stentor coeruleus TaxID=5963 RepID=A0A1R2BQ72_9CILI|nr:hypothetical protein SteCoe_21107 [Stentor coeruleus]